MSLQKNLKMNLDLFESSSLSIVYHSSGNVEASYTIISEIISRSAVPNLVFIKEYKLVFVVGTLSFDMYVSDVYTCIFSYSYLYHMDIK